MISFCLNSTGLEPAILHRLQAAFLSSRSGTESEADWLFVERECGAGLVSPLAYAAREGEVSILPGLAVGEIGDTGSLVLRFAPQQRDIRRVLYPIGARMDQILASIVLREKYDLTPQFLAVDPADLHVREEGDAVLLTDPDALDDGIDIVDEWFDYTQLPFVRSIVVGWNDMVDETVLEPIRRIGEEGDEESVRLLDTVMQGHLSPDQRHQVFSHRRYLLDETMQDALRVFYHFAFLHGQLRDVPDLTLWS